MARNRDQGGNVLFLILIAVALFAALSYAVTQSTRSGGGKADKEKLELDLNTMLQYTAALRQGIVRLMMTNGCTDEQLSVYSDQLVNPTSAENVNSPVDKHCHLFDKAGANIAWQRPPKSAQNVGGVEYVMSVGTPVVDVGLDGCDRTELIAETYIPREMCILLNEKMGNPNPSGEPPVSSQYRTTMPGWHNQLGWGSSPGVTEYSCGVSIGYPGDALELKGKTTGCFYVGSEDLYLFYDVLLAR